MKGSSTGRPILRLFVSTANSADDSRLEAALAEIAQQSPGIRTKRQDRLYGIEGMTEAELDSICDRLRDQYDLAIKVDPPEALLLETIRWQAEAEGKYIRQVRGSGNYGHCRIRIEPNELGRGYEFINEINPDTLQPQFARAIDSGVQTAMNSGILRGLPIVDVKVTLFDASYHEADSNETAFNFAGSIAFKDALKRASPVLLEPVMAFDFDVPDAFTILMEDEINQHHGRIDRMRSENGRSEIRAIVPLSELLASTSSVLAAYPMEFAGYEAIRNDNSSNDDESGVTANKPNYPRQGSRSEAVRPEEE